MDGNAAIGQMIIHVPGHQRYRIIPGHFAQIHRDGTGSILCRGIGQQTAIIPDPSAQAAVCGDHKDHDHKRDDDGDHRGRDPSLFLLMFH